MKETVRERAKAHKNNFPLLHIYHKPITVFVLCQLTVSLKIHQVSKEMLQLGEFLCQSGLWKFL